MKKIFDILQNVWGLILVFLLLGSPLLIIFLLDKLDPILPDLLITILVFAFHTCIAYSAIKDITSIKNRIVLLLLSVLSTTIVWSLFLLLAFLPDVWEYFIQMTLTAQILVFITLALITTAIALIIFIIKNKALKEELSTVNIECNRLHSELANSSPREETIKILQQAETIRALRKQVSKLENHLQEMQTTKNQHESDSSVAIIDALNRMKNNNAFQCLLSETSLYTEMQNCDIDYCKQRIHSALSESMVIGSIIGFSDLSCEIITGEKENQHKYHTSFKKCSCPDYQNRHHPCKHMYRLAIECGQLWALTEAIKEEKAQSRHGAYQEHKKRGSPCIR